MPLLALGINHQSAPITIRERVAFAPEQMEEALHDAREALLVQDVAILSTCNRTELFAFCTEDAESGHQQRALEWLAAYHHVPLSELLGCHYAFTDTEAIRHMMKVACGLDSMVLGEPQILGQMKSAFAVAREAGVIRSELGRVFQQVFSAAKRVRTETAIGENPVSVAFASVSLARHIFADFSTATALLVGAGETIELVARHLVDAGVKKIIVANRTLGRARQLAENFGAEAVLLSEIPEQLPRADIVITSTASQLPILGKGAVERAIKLRKRRPIFMVDIAVPRDIEPEVGSLDDIYLYSVDDLQGVINENRRSRENEARKADSIIDQCVEQCLRAMRSQGAVETLKAYRGKAEAIRDQELDKALRLLQRGGDPEQVLGSLARGLTNKLIHNPSIQLKEASAEGREDLLKWAHRLFDLDDQ